jgi:hypothetical protein
MIFPVIRYAAPFGDCHELIRLETRYRLVRLALRPLDFYFVNLVGGAQPELQPKIALGRNAVLRPICPISHITTLAVP